MRADLNFMERMNIQKVHRQLFAVLLAIAVFSTVLLGSFAVSARTAEAQAIPFVGVREPRPPVPPFGYGGGPQEPRVPDTQAILERIFERLNLIFSNIFNR
jgi:hypothetical protein